MAAASLRFYVITAHYVGTLLQGRKYRSCAKPAHFANRFAVLIFQMLALHIFN